MKHKSQAKLPTPVDIPSRGISIDMVYHFTEAGMQAHNRQIMLNVLKIVGESVADLMMIVKMNDDSLVRTSAEGNDGR